MTTSSTTASLMPCFPMKNDDDECVAEVRASSDEDYVSELASRPSHVCAI